MITHSRWRFRLTLLILLATLVLLAVAAFGLINRGGYYVSVAILVVAFLFVLSLVLHKVESSFRTTEQFFTAAVQGDFSQSISNTLYASEMRDAFFLLIKKLKDERIQHESENAYLRALIRQAPVAILAFDELGRISLFNHAASKLLGLKSPATLADLDQAIDGFGGQLQAMQAGQRSLVKSNSTGLELSLIISSSQARVHGKNQVIVTIENIGKELIDTEYQAWKNLISVLTHEVMNSVTPIVSLATTSRDILLQADLLTLPAEQLQSELADATQAMVTVANRSQGIIQFVDGYRSMARLPKPALSKILLTTLFADLQVLQKPLLSNKKIQLDVQIEPSSLTVFADQQQLEQVLINLLKNSLDACVLSHAAQIHIHAFMRGAETVLSVTDNGAGIDKEVLPQICMPFFTTKRHGTGIGMALTRQVMHAHGGRVVINSNLGCGTRVELIFLSA